MLNFKIFALQLDQVAMNSILDELEEGDRFNILMFGGHVSVYEENGMIDATQRDIRKAKNYIKNRSPYGCKLFCSFIILFSV
jgi:prepilin-type processing-associated H-X9-DG protein